MKYFSMFSGIGGFELGIKQAIQDVGFIQQENTGHKPIPNRTPSQYNQSDGDKEGITISIDRQKEKNEHIKQESNMSNIEIRTRFREQFVCECIGFSEIDKYAINTYLSHFPEHKNYGDAKKIDPELIPDFDLLCGGFPCQSFSIAGKRKGFQDTRGTLFYEILRICESKKPRLLFLENVRGLLSADNGRSFHTILSCLDRRGYDAEWQVLNSKHFGVPQNRERVFIIGHLRGSSFRQVFPLRQDGRLFIETEAGSESESQFCSTISTKEGGRKESNFVVSELNELTCNMSQGQRVYDSQGISSTIRSGGGGLGGKTGLYKIYNLHIRSEDRPSLTRVCDCGSGLLYKKCCGTDAGSGLLSREDGNTYCLDSHNTQAVAIPVLCPDRENVRAEGRRFKEDNEASFTITAMDKHGIYNGSRVRRLTPVECERLQGFPDNWTLGSDSQRYKQLGNAVTVNVIKAIVEGIMENEQLNIL